MQQELVSPPTPAKAICTATGLTLAQLADELSVSTSTAQSWSIGRLEMSDRVLRKISALFGVELKTLIEQGRAVMRSDGLPLTAQRWQAHRERQAKALSGVRAALDAGTPEKTIFHAELSAALRRAADRGEVVPTGAEIVAFLRSL